MKTVYIVHACILAIAIAMTAILLRCMVKHEAEGGDGVAMERGALLELEEDRGAGQERTR